MADIKKKLTSEIDRFLYVQGIEIIRYLDIANLPEVQTMGYPYAIHFVMPLTKAFLSNSASGKIDEFLEKEAAVETLADQLAVFLQNRGYKSYAQTDANNIAIGNKEQNYASPNLVCGISVLPQKTLGRLGGLGFIGRNNLLITEEYGCGFCMCSVLTYAPVKTQNYELKPNRCGTCSACLKACATGALKGGLWREGLSREDLLEVSKCTCALECMVNCPWTKRYAMGNQKTQ